MKLKWLNRKEEPHINLLPMAVKQETHHEITLVKDTQSTQMAISILVATLMAHGKDKENIYMLTAIDMKALSLQTKNTE